MKTSCFPLQTIKETPADAEVISHQLMLRAGMIRRLASGLYTWLPMGLKVLRKVEAIIREEMNAAGALELLMPAVQPAELWIESTRWEQYGPELLRMKDRHQREFCFGPTHEEVITDLARREMNSYKQLPVNYYQIQTKFRDEIRPRFGIMRAREFLMKDAYSFHMDAASLNETYRVMHQTYHRIFQRIGLNFRAVSADSGNIGGSTSHEFHVLAKSGEDAIAFASEGDYAANIEMAEAIAQPNIRSQSSKEMQCVDTPGQHTIAEVSQFLKQPPEKCLKTLLVKGAEHDVVALVMRGDHELNILKAEKLALIAAPLTFAENEEIVEHVGCQPGSIGPVDMKVPVIVDRSAAKVSDFVCGANKEGQHYQFVNWARDLPEPQTADLRNVVEGDPSPDGKGVLNIARGIEVGHIFQLGKKYTQALNATVLDEAGQSVVMSMGCYGIGVSRVVAAAIEQNYDEKGIIWPLSIAPFSVAVLPMNMHKSENVKVAAETIYRELLAAGIDVILDDRKVRPGFMFADMELIGVPYRIVIGEKSLKDNVVEFKGRQDSDAVKISVDEIVSHLTNLLKVSSL